MTSLNGRPFGKRWREYPKRIIIKFIELSFSSIKWIFRYSGLEFIYRKFNPSKNPQPLPIGFIWLIGIYVASFGVASQRYENRVDIIDNRVNSISAELANDVYKKALSRISTVQNMWCPEKPEILNPLSVIRSLFKETENQELVQLLKETIEDWKEKLDGVDLYQAKLAGASLEKANLNQAQLRRAELQKAKLQREPACREPTCREPTSFKPTSIKPSSRKPTSWRPTSKEPSSCGPSSREPSSRKPISGKPTSKKPCSMAPTSREPTSRGPTSGEPKV